MALPWIVHPALVSVLEDMGYVCGVDFTVEGGVYCHVCHLTLWPGEKHGPRCTVRDE